MRKVFLALLFSALAFFPSCAFKQEATSSSESKPPQNEAALVQEVLYPQIDGYSLLSASIIGEDDFVLTYKLLGGDYYFANYRLDAKKQSLKLLYEGENPASYFAIYVKKHPNDTFSIQFGDNRVLIFDLTTN